MFYIQFTQYFCVKCSKLIHIAYTNYILLPYRTTNNVGNNLHFLGKCWHCENLEFDLHEGDVRKEFAGWNSRNEKFKVISRRKIVHLSEKFSMFWKTVPWKASTPMY